MNNGDGKRFKFTADKRLLDYFIQRQAGTLEKALLEGIMNAVDAGAKRIDITVKQDPDSNTWVAGIRDDGCGFSSLKQIKQVFGTFGLEQSADEKGNKTFGEFRIGRGQMFCFGRNIWRSGRHIIEVDYRERGIEYSVCPASEPISGCCVEIYLYDSPLPAYGSVDNLCRQITEQVEFISTPIFFNGVRISHDPARLKWSAQDDNAYYRLRKGRVLTVYNLGARVMSVPQSRFGLTGIVVSKKRLEINMSRNDVLSTCPVYQSICGQLLKERKRLIREAEGRKRKKLSTDERMAILMDIRAGSLDSIPTTVGLLRATNGKMIPLRYFSNMFADDNGRNPTNRNTGIRHWTFAPAGSPVADSLITGSAVICLDDTILDDLKYTGKPENFFLWLVQDYRDRRAWYREYSGTPNFYKSFEDLSDGIDDTLTIVPRDKWTAYERRAIESLAYIFPWERTLLVGQSDTAAGWTDGSTYIAIERRTLTKPLKALLTAIHELAHDDSTGCEYGHTFDFYQRFHDLCMDDKDGPLANVDKFKSHMEELKRREISAARSEREKRANAEIRKALKLQQETIHA